MYITTMGVVKKKLTLLRQLPYEDYKTGTVNCDQVVFNFTGEDWENINKVAVFITDNGDIFDVPLTNNICTIPPEVYNSIKLTTKNMESISSIAVGVYGIIIENEKITKVLPTNLVSMPLSLGSYFPRF